MRLAASTFIINISLLYGCSTNCDMNTCPNDLAPSNISVTYYDGAANGYIFMHGTVEYLPVKREESSSLGYSGGTPFKRPIDAQTYRPIADAFNLAIAANSTHISDRVMGSAVVSIKCSHKSRDWIIAPNSPQLAKIESLLQALRKATPAPAQP